MEQAKLLLIDFDPPSGLCGKLREILEGHFNLLERCLGADELAAQNYDFSEFVSSFNPDLIFLVLPNTLLKQALGAFQSVGIKASQSPCILVLEEGDPDDTFALLKLGAADFLTTPLKTTDILPRIWRLLDQDKRAIKTAQQLKEKLGLRSLVGESPALMAEVKKIPVIARCDANVMISGETGTGKEVYARAVHYLSPRAGKPFIPVNCGAIPVELVENELFGHERGAFTGASAAHAGLLQEAEGGTLFLDEIDCLPLLAQIKLLRFLQEKEYRPLGSTRIHSADVRVIGASNVDFEEAVRAGKLRKDLYYRLNVIRLMLPPLRERREDIPLLVQYFLEKYSAAFSKRVTDFPPDAMHMLFLYDWPGNVRELEHVIERAVVLCEHGIIRASDIFMPGCEQTVDQESFQQAKAKIVSQFEISYIQRLLRAYQGNITRAAQAANKDRRAFWQLIRKHRIDVSSFKSYA